MSTLNSYTARAPLSDKLFNLVVYVRHNVCNRSNALSIFECVGDFL